MTEPQPSYAPENVPQRGKSGRGWAVAGIISGLVAIVLLPIILGPAGVVLGIVGFVKGSRGLGVAAILAGVLGFVLGFVLSLIVVSMTNQA